MLKYVTKEGLSPKRINIYTEGGIVWQWRTLHLQVLVQEEHGCARQMADSSGWSSERRGEKQQ